MLKNEYSGSITYFYTVETTTMTDSECLLCFEPMAADAPRFQHPVVGAECCMVCLVKARPQFMEEQAARDAALAIQEKANLEEGVLARQQAADAAYALLLASEYQCVCNGCNNSAIGGETENPYCAAHTHLRQ